MMAYFMVLPLQSVLTSSMAAWRCARVSWLQPDLPNWHFPRLVPPPDSSLQLLILGDGFEDFSRDVVAGDPFALGGEVRDDAVAKNRRRHRRHVVAAHVELAMQHGAGFGGQDEVQAGARTGP